MPAETLRRRLAVRIRREGPLKFDRFQEAALFDPESGYYEKEGRVGKNGDFVTGASWHPAFARCLAKVAKTIQQELGTKIDIVDVGAGEGELLGAMSAALTADAGDSDTGNYRFSGVERSETRRKKARERLPNTSWFSSFEEIPRFSGLLVAYELFDALPVRALFFDGEKLVERFVGVRARRTEQNRETEEKEKTGDTEDFFEWKEGECVDSEALLERLRARGAVLRPGQLLEVRPGSRSLSLSFAEKISSGLVLVFDYGAPTRALYGSARISGTLSSFQAHQVSRDVLSEPGSRDITAWVDFGEIEEAFIASGLTVHGLVSQSRFLSAAGMTRELELVDASPGTSAERLAEKNAIAKLFAPEGMGESIRVLVAGRGLRTGTAWVKWPKPPEPPEPDVGV
jgi:SAM-dependent MidA family methyltransferase